MLSDTSPMSVIVPFDLETEHFVGYYDVCPWSPDNRLLLAHSASLAGGIPGPDDTAEIVVAECSPDGTDNSTRRVGSTRAWNWQLGARAQWLASLGRRRLVFNRRRDDGFGSDVVDIDSGAVERELPFPVYAVSPSEPLAAFVDFGRLHRLRPGYGYAPARAGSDADRDPSPIPANVGLFLGDLDGSGTELVVSHSRLADRIGGRPFDDRDRPRWIEHPTFSPDGERLAFLYRTRTGDGGLETRLVATDPRGRSFWLPQISGVTHYAWLDAGKLVAWGRDPGSPAGFARRLPVPEFLLRLARSFTRRHRSGAVRESIMGDRYHLIDVEGGRVAPFAEGTIGQDGHCTPSPTSDVVLCDTYPDDEGRQRLYLVDPETGGETELGIFVAPLGRGPARCDLHPRWDREGGRVCFDSAHEGGRQVYVMDVTEALADLRSPDDGRPAP